MLSVAGGWSTSFCIHEPSRQRRNLTLYTRCSTVLVTVTEPQAGHRYARYSVHCILPLDSFADSLAGFLSRLRPLDSLTDSLADSRTRLSHRIPLPDPLARPAAVFTRWILSLILSRDCLTRLARWTRSLESLDSLARPARGLLSLILADFLADSLPRFARLTCSLDSLVGFGVNSPDSLAGPAHWILFLILLLLSC